jgi:hypothetical protein
MKQPKTHTIVIFPDGQTWNVISGTKIKVVHDKSFERLCNDEIDACDIPAVVELTLQETTFNVLGVD